MAAEIPDGAVVVARGILNSSLWTMRTEDRILAITCIALCNFKDRKWFDGQKNVIIKRGSFVRSLAKLSEAARLSIKSTRTSLKRLEKSEFLARTSTNRFTLITLPKYDFYQQMGNYSDSAGMKPGKQPASSGQALGNKQEGKEGKEGEGGPISPPGAEPDHELEELVALAINKTKIPNNPETIRKNVDAARSRRGANWVRRWLGLLINEGRTVLDLQDAIKAAPASAPPPPTPKGPKCDRCDGVGHVPVEEIVRGEKVTNYGRCPRCKARGYLPLEEKKESTT